MPVLNLAVAFLRDRLLLLSLLVERFVLTLINEDYYYYYYEMNESLEVCRSAKVSKHSNLRDNFYCAAWNADAV